MASVEKELSDEELRKLLKPNPTDEKIRAVLAETFATDSEELRIAASLESYDDRNYKVEIGGTPFLLKVHNGVESLDMVKVWKEKGNDYNACGNSSVIHLQNALMNHLNENGVPTSKPQLYENAPMVVKSLSVVSPNHSPQDLVVRLLSWVEGKAMSSVKFLPIEALAGAGRFLGEMDAKLDLFDTSSFAAAKRFHAWDGKNTVGLKQFTECIQDERRRGMVLSVLDAFQSKILDSGVGDKFRKGMIMGDYNDANILIDDEYRVSGVIDFGDSVESWRILDLSVAMTYSMLSVLGKKRRSLSAAAAILRGFHSVYPVQDLEFEQLYLLMACRLSCSVTLGAYSYQQQPENKYLLLHAEPGWEALEFLWGYDEARRSKMDLMLKQVFKTACSKCEISDDGVIDCSDIDFPDPNVADPFAPVRLQSNGANTAKRRKLVHSGDKKAITFVTGNKKKLEEVKRILGGDDLPFEIRNEKIDLPELQGDPLDIAREKCADAAREIGSAVITEDTSLCFTALKGLPGPYIKWFLDKCGHKGLNDLIGTSEDKSAYAQTVVAFSAGPGQEVVVFDGRTVGKIVPARGKLDFGWDPIFEPDEGKGLTYGEMSKEAKDAISHRSRAFAKLRSHFVREKGTINNAIN